MNKKIIKFCLIIFLINFFFQLFIFTPEECNAGSLLDETFKCTGGDSRNPAEDCTLNDFIRIAIKITEIILGLCGSLALIAFIYGGVLMLISGGSSEKVNKAKSIIAGAVIGLIIIFASYAIIGFIFTALDIRDENQQKIGPTGWSKINWFSNK